MEKMEKKVLTFEEFIIESYNLLLNEEEGSNRDGVFYIKSGASSSKIGTDLAKKLGIESGYIYDIEISGLGVLYFDENETLEKKGIKIEKKEKASSDILKIGDKEIKDKGSIILTKEDVEKLKKDGKLNIRAANNGLLVLRRFGGTQGGLKSIWKNAKFALSQMSDYMVNFTLGGDPSDETSRGSKWVGSWFDSDFSNASRSNSILEEICACLVKLKGGEVLNGTIVNNLTKDVLEKNKIEDYAKRINDLLEIRKKSLIEEKYLVNPKTVDYNNGVKELLSDYKKYTTKYKNKIKLTGEVDKAIRNYFDKVISMWCDDPQAPKGYDEINKILPAISKTLKKSFGNFKGSFMSPVSAIESVQEEKKSSPSSRKEGNIGSEDKKQKEGQF